MGNIALDGLSSNKYYAFVRLMGRAASNIALEVALQTHPTICLLGEEVAARHQNLASIAEEIASVVAERAAEGKNQGVILVPEGLIEVSEQHCADAPCDSCALHSPSLCVYPARPLGSCCLARC